MHNKKLIMLASERIKPCVTISMTTHQTHPASAPDLLTLQGLLKEARERVINEFEKENVAGLLKYIDELEVELDVNYLNYSLNSLHLFISNKIKEVIKSPLTVKENTVQVGDSFALKPLIKALNRTDEYYILLISQSGAQLFHALNDSILEEISNDDFPFDEKLREQKLNKDHDQINLQKFSEPAYIEKSILEYFNPIDKGIVKLHHQTELNCVVICTENNYSRLLKIADIPSIYLGHVEVNYNDTKPQSLADAAWQIIQHLQKQERAKEIEEMQEAVGNGLVFTDLAEILRAAKEGKGDLLIVHDDFHQAVKMNADSTFELVNDDKQADVIDDITSEIAWEVFSKKGRVVFTDQEEIKSLGDIALKVRY
jgi:hypothetical protein